MKRIRYPYFHVSGLVKIYEAGEVSPVAKIKAGGYINFHDDVYSVMLRDAKWKLDRLGVPKERIVSLFFEDQEITDLVAMDSIRVKRIDGERPEAFFDFNGIAKRDTLIRQRRLVPQDQREMVAIYGPKIDATKRVEEVAS